jgi:class 3 adenylate cyclase
LPSCPTEPAWRPSVGGRTLVGGLTDAPHAPVRTFLIADIRGYTRFTEQYGDEASARLAAKFSDLVEETLQVRGGALIEIRGDEALAVFDSTRQAIRAAMDLQKVFAEESEADSDLPLRVGIGIDSGEAIELEDGSFRGAALNVAARLCALARGGEVLVSEGSSRLAGRLPGVRFIDSGRANLKGIAQPLRVMRAAPEEEQEKSRPWIVMFFGGQKRLGWRVGLAVVVIAAATAATVVYLTGGTEGDKGTAASGTGGAAASDTQTESVPQAPIANITALIPASLRKTCVKQQVPDINALETAVCVPKAGGTAFVPDRWQVSTYPNGSALKAAYEAERRRHKIALDQGRCTGLSWGGEGPWSHGPGKPGGRRLCYFDGNDAVIVWTHERLGQPTHRDILASAREGGSDHQGLFGWWAVSHHQIGKVG